MVALPLIIPVFQMITEKGPSNSPVEEPKSGHAWHDSTTRDREMESQDDDGQHDTPRHRHGGVAIDIDLQPALEEPARDPQAHAVDDVEYPRVSPNHGRKDTRFMSFPSISAWSARSSRSSFNITKNISCCNAMQRLWAFILQNDGRHTEDEFIPNYRWLPILSGITIPFIILLQIPGLTERW